MFPLLSAFGAVVSQLGTFVDKANRYVPTVTLIPLVIASVIIGAIADYSTNQDGLANFLGSTSDFTKVVIALALLLLFLTAASALSSLQARLDLLFQGAWPPYPYLRWLSYWKRQQQLSCLRESEEKSAYAETLRNLIADKRLELFSDSGQPETIVVARQDLDLGQIIEADDLEVRTAANDPAATEDSRRLAGFVGRVTIETVRRGETLDDRRAVTFPQAAWYLGMEPVDIEARSDEDVQEESIVDVHSSVDRSLLNPGGSKVIGGHVSAGESGQLTILVQPDKVAKLLDNREVDVTLRPVQRTPWWNDAQPRTRRSIPLLTTAEQVVQQLPGVQSDVELVEPGDIVDISYNGQAPAESEWARSAIVLEASGTDFVLAVPLAAHRQPPRSPSSWRLQRSRVEVPTLRVGVPKNGLLPTGPDDLVTIAGYVKGGKFFRLGAAGDQPENERPIVGSVKILRGKRAAHAIPLDTVIERGWLAADSVEPEACFLDWAGMGVADEERPAADSAVHLIAECDNQAKHVALQCYTTVRKGEQEGEDVQGVIVPKSLVPRFTADKTRVTWASAGTTRPEVRIWENVCSLSPRGATASPGQHVLVRFVALGRLQADRDTPYIKQMGFALTQESGGRRSSRRPNVQLLTESTVVDAHDYQIVLTYPSAEQQARVALTLDQQIDLIQRARTKAHCWLEYQLHRATRITKNDIEETKKWLDSIDQTHRLVKMLLAQSGEVDSLARSRLTEEDRSLNRILSHACTAADYFAIEFRRQRQSLFPSEAYAVQPTAVGNLLRSVESYAKRMYKMDATVMLPYLLSVLDDKTSNRLSGAQDRLYMLEWAFVGSVAVGFLGSSVAVLNGKYGLALVTWVASVGPLRALLKSAVTAAALGYAQALRLAIDSQRGKVIAALGMQASFTDPVELKQEQQFWNAVGEWFTSTDGEAPSTLGKYTVPGLPIGRSDTLEGG